MQVTPVGENRNEAQERALRNTFEKMEGAIRENSCLMFSTAVCPYCTYAKDFIEKFGKKCNVIDLSKGENKQLGAVVTAVTNQRTVPNIFLHQMHVGGYDELVAVEKQCQNTDSVLFKDKQYAEVCGFFGHQTGGEGQ
ncbi:unnamed protein product [Amoebophrya sp. A25]|nr:unnamed protein product [Amoebophrya sp. A25]|eukprot:GSA25T00007656001.1